jgi:Ca2+-binding RTX toxin-like protein
MRILLIALLAVAALPAAADAATVSRTGGTLRYVAGKNERISAELIETSGGDFLVRKAKNVRQRLVPGAGCRRGGAREVRCAGQSVTRVENSMKRARTSSVMVHDIRVPVAAVGSEGTNTMSFTRTPDFTYDGGPKRDDVAVRDSPGGHSAIRLGAGADFFDGQPPALGAPDSPVTFTVDGGPGRDSLMGGPAADFLDGGPGNDALDGGGGADTLTGGPGTDTAGFTSFSLIPNHDDGPISVTLDGQRNDGTAGQNALVGSDVENAAIGFTTQPGSDDVLVGNGGPNVLIGPGTVRGLGGNDTLVTNDYHPDNHTTLDGGDGDDRIDALARNDGSGSPASTPASVVCGAGSDVVFTSVAVPADCERANVGMHVRGARSIGRKGVVRARIGCNDPHGCVLAWLTLKLHGHQAGVRTARIKIPFGASRIASAQLKPRVWRRHRHDRSLRVEITPFPQPTAIPSPAVSTGSYPRALTLRIIH